MPINLDNVNDHEREAVLEERIAELEVENARMRSALELIASDGHEWPVDVAKAALTGKIEMK